MQIKQTRNKAVPLTFLCPSRSTKKAGKGIKPRILLNLLCPLGLQPTNFYSQWHIESNNMTTVTVSLSDKITRYPFMAELRYSA